MKSLSLYVDKWFITVAINFDGNVIPLSLPNGEDRIWLYFHEDTANSRIEYGKVFENNYRDRQPHYFGDIFNLIEEGDHHFTRYERRREEMRDIFKVAEIFNHLHQAVGEEESVDTYISFSSDIPDVARLRFIEELEEANFKVIESVARISHLALEECKKRNIFTALGTYLALVATNDNFHFALYENKGNIFLRKNEGTLIGLGMDVRRRALVEAIVDNINKNTKFLNRREEIDMECVRQNRFATDWLDKIAKSKPNMPVAFDGVTFAVAPNNPAMVSISPNTLNSRTNGIVEDMVRKIADFIKENQLPPHEIKGIVFVGNTFTNQSFAMAINNKFIVDDNKFVIYREEDLPKVVSVYSQIDCSQFKGATEEFITDAKTQEILNKQAKEEEEKKQKAIENARRQQELIDSHKKADRDYNNAIENIERHESDHNYVEMLEWADIAMKIRPDDEFAKEKAALARQLLAEQKATDKQFNLAFQRAKTAFSEERWSDVISQCEMALELRPDSEEVSHLKAEARRRMDVKEKVHELLNRADIFFAQKLYSEALREVSKILSLDSSNQDAKEIKRKISEEQQQQEKEVSKLKSQLNEAEGGNDFVLAINICQNLIDKDFSNITQWSNRKERLVSKQQEHEENRRKLNELKSDIQAARQNGDWQKVLELTRNALASPSDSEIEKWNSEAQEAIQKIKIEQIQNEFLEAAADEEWEKVITLYDENTFLKLKSSNSTWYQKAKLCLKSKSDRINRPKPQSIDSSDTKKRPEETPGAMSGIEKKVHKKRLKAGPKRPSLSTRPTADIQNRKTKEITADKTPESPTRDDANNVLRQDSGNKNSCEMPAHRIDHTKTKKVTNKPKR